MTLKFIECKNGMSFLVNEVPDELRKRIDILFGYSLRLYCERTITLKNQRGTESFSNYVASKPIQICHNSDILKQRNATELEQSIFLTIQHHQKLNSNQKNFLKENFLSIVANN